MPAEKTSRLNGSTGTSTWLPATLAKNSTPILRSTGNPNPTENWCFAIEKGLSTSGMIEPPRCHSSCTGKFHTNTTCIQPKKTWTVPMDLSTSFCRFFVNALLLRSYQRVLLSVCKYTHLLQFSYFTRWEALKNSNIGYLNNPCVFAKQITITTSGHSLYICYCYHVWPLEESHGWTQIHLIPYHIHLTAI